jgi:SAM-dependent methyltransferase
MPEGNMFDLLTLKMKRILKKIHWIASSQLGLNLLILMQSLRGLPRFLQDWQTFSRKYRGTLTLAPCLHDRFEEGGSTNTEYFWQDLLVARWVFDARPQTHVDVGSRVDGFVAHVASYRDIEVFDVRPIRTQIQSIKFTQADLMNMGGESYPQDTYCDSLSCLHALEHFGLGRYGDPIDAYGHERGLANMVRLLQPGGVFYLSVPIGRARVEFNANRIFDPRDMVQLAGRNGLVLERLVVIKNGSEVTNVEGTDTELQALAEENYSLGIFVFKKIVQ